MTPPQTPPVRRLSLRLISRHRLAVKSSLTATAPGSSPAVAGASRLVCQPDLVEPAATPDFRRPAAPPKPSGVSRRRGNQVCALWNQTDAGHGPLESMEESNQAGGGHGPLKSMERSNQAGAGLVRWADGRTKPSWRGACSVGADERAKPSWRRAWSVGPTGRATATDGIRGMSAGQGAISLVGSARC